ncbi:hypothetical protein [Flavobacterium sp. UGB4466]|uniref:hypothetical protein n=1 Tax=Flavobacterium sp. UGB4466 TaxID=2730889 RepID=UPI00192CB389|nr:hypothetical protein [Flavobacterium sp. UGB4466]
MFSILSRPTIVSYEEDQDSCMLNVYLKSRKCGFICISQKHVVFHLSCGWSKIGKGASDIKSVFLKYANNQMIIFRVYDNKEILVIKCDQIIYEKALYFLKNKQREMNVFI